LWDPYGALFITLLESTLSNNATNPKFTMMTLWTGSKELHLTSVDKIGPNEEEDKFRLRNHK